MRLTDTATEEELSNSALNEAVRLQSKGLYILLNNRIKQGRAKDILEAVNINEGFIAWKRLCAEYQKDEPGRYNAMLSGLLSPNFDAASRSTGRSFRDLLREWVNAVDRYRKQSKQPSPRT